MIIASPWSRGGWVNSQLFDHTSTLIFLEAFHAEQVRQDGKGGEYQRVAARHLWRSYFVSSGPHDPKHAELDFLDRDKFVMSIQQARYKEVPSNYSRLSATQIAEINSDPLQALNSPRIRRRAYARRVRFRMSSMQRASRALTGQDSNC